MGLEDDPNTIYGTTLPHKRDIHQVVMLWASSVIGPYFSQNDVGERHKTMLTDLFSPELNNMEVDVIWFQQNGAMYHTADSMMDILHERFEGLE